VGTGENQPHPARPCRPQTRGSDPASVDVREKIPDERRDAEGNSGLRVSSEVIDNPREPLWLRLERWVRRSNADCDVRSGRWQ